MTQNLSRLLWFFTIAFHAVMISIVISVLNAQLQYKSEIEATATANTVATNNYFLTNPPPTDTPIPTATWTPLPTPTVTPTPCYAQTITDGVVYLQPSKGKTIGSISVTDISIPLIFRLQNENWWKTEVRDERGQLVQRWINSDTIVNSELCNNLRMVNLENILEPLPESIFVADTFSAFDFEWLTSDGSPSNRSPNIGESNLQIRSGNGQPVSSFLNEIILRSPFTLITSFERENFGRGSYVGIRLNSQSNAEQFIELHIEADQCNAIWIDQNGVYPTIPLGSGAACDNDDIEDFLILNIIINDNMLQLGGEYNNVILPAIKFIDVFDDAQLNLIIFDGEVEFKYMLITQTLMEAK